MKELLNNLANLLKVKSLLSLIVIITVSVLVLTKTEIDPMYAGLASSIVTYFFTKSEVK